jgi:2-polyprenyl-3-methyl-5-hydroxy-6-metoxy-1,4-benzoquinol methylase
MTDKKEFIDDDISGETTLDVISEADKFNEWMYNTIKPHCHGKILEIGSGVGNISNFFLRDGFEITLTDIREGYCSRLEKEFGGHSNLLGIELIDLVDPDFDEKYSNHFSTYDTVFALNVVEHIHDDTLALKNCYKLLSEKGRLIILVPSYQGLFNQFDTELGHYRRYTKKKLSTVFEKADYKITHKQYFNFIGIFGWYITGNILRKKTIPKGQMKLYNKLVPVFKVIDKVILESIGLSTIIVGKKKLN